MPHVDISFSIFAIKQIVLAAFLEATLLHSSTDITPVLYFINVLLLGLHNLYFDSNCNKFLSEGNMRIPEEELECRQTVVVKADSSLREQMGPN